VAVVKEAELTDFMWVASKLMKCTKSMEAWFASTARARLRLPSLHLFPCV